MRPFFILSAILTLPVINLAAQQSLPPDVVGLSSTTITHTTQPPVLPAITQEDVQDFRNGLGFDDVNFQWISHPNGRTRSEKTLMKNLTKDCHKMGLGFVPHVFVVGPTPKPTGPLSAEPIDYVVGFIDNIGPYILYRSDVYEKVKRNERLGMADHELLHLEKLIDRFRQNSRHVQSLVEARQEELDADHEAVVLHHGKGLYNGLRKLNVIAAEDYNAYNAVAEKPTSITFEEAQKIAAPESDHPLLADREALLAKAIKEQKRNERLRPRWLGFHN